MTELIATQPIQESFGTFNAGLPLLAVRAAIELDSIIRQGGTSDLAATSRLAELLSESFTRKENEKAAEQPHLDPTTIALMSQALDASKWDVQVRTVSELVQEALNIVKRLESPRKADEPKESLKNLRAFCAALAECAAAQVQSMHSWRPAHPYRR
jgi:hypothetical protein